MSSRRLPLRTDRLASRAARRYLGVCGRAGRFSWFLGSFARHVALTFCLASSYFDASCRFFRHIFPLGGFFPFFSIGGFLMPAVAPYIPTKQSLFDAWLLNFSTLITANPNLYGLVSGDATNISTDYTNWHAAYLLVTSPTTKSPSNVSAKNTQYSSIIAAIRAYAQQISNNPGVTSANKIALGLNPKTSLPTPVTAPTTNPVLTIQSQSAGQVILRYRDSAASVSVKSKPYGVTQLRLLAKSSATPITDPTQLVFVASLTKSPSVVSLAAFTPGSVVYFAAQWATRKGLVSGYSPIIAVVST